MGSVLQYIDENNEGGYKCYKTRKISLDENIKDTVSENSDLNVVPAKNKSRIVETNPSKSNTVLIAEKIIKNNKTPWFRYFLDGSRHVYKVDDIAIGNKIYPIVAGQVIVGCCRRDNRDSFKKEKILSHIIIAMPEVFYTQRAAKRNDVTRLYCEQMNEWLKQNNRYFRNNNIKIDKIVYYKTDGPGIDESDVNKYRNSGIAQIQNEMTDEEQLMVSELCKEKKLNDDNWLIKDGSLQYTQRFSNMDSAQFNTLRSNYGHVVGVSKSFNPDLLKNHEGKKMAPIIASLKPFERTIAYEYSDGTQLFAIWYVRLRKEVNFRETQFSDIVKCEMVLTSESQKLDSDDVDSISANLIQEAYPVCYGKDTRWANHLYPVYLTESFCKSNYISNNVFLSLF